MERRRHHRGRSGCADVALRTNGEEEQRRAQQLGHHPQHQHVRGHPDRAEQEQPRPIQQRQQVHLHADAGDQEVQEHRAQPRRTGRFQPAGTGEAQAQAHRRGQQDHPDELAVQAELAGPADIGLEPARQRRGDGMGQADAAQCHANDHHQVGHAGNARVLRLVGTDARLHLVDGTGVGTIAGVDLLCAVGQEQQDRHPQAGTGHVNHRELAEGGGIGAEHLAHGDHVGAATDPAAGQRRHAGPGITGHGFRMDQLHQLERNDGAEHDAGGTGTEHDQKFRAELDDAFQVDRQGQQDQRGRQQHVTRDRVVQRGVVAIDDTGGVVDGGDEIAQQQGRHPGEDLLQQRGWTTGGPEDQGQGGGNQAQSNDVVADQGSSGFGRHGILCRSKERRKKSAA
ncbi:hypothetical protein PGKDCPLP_00380 [Stenotrophomonas maltophilia]|nr:hypothetical protein PGKDCPLP_00380 [Stenotrophomonas maltophilia]